ncbi:MAG: UDP-N-acetylmuramate:L-alanyl-gamma-D-glutamyl-meso-diaminopimelate ligase, partial [Gammaproteobacteria bacterium]
SGFYPPMSDYLSASGFAFSLGWDPAVLSPRPDLVIVGNSLSRGNPVIETLLDHEIPFTSGPAWLAEHVLLGKHVLAVAGTHGKTTTASLLTWILDAADYRPGFLIGGIPENFGEPSRLSESPYFVIEADEYDTAFFDKRSKFVHYRPRTLVLNNLEYDHADIFPDLAAIQTQFHHLIRVIPRRGTILWNGDEPALAATLAKGCWTPTTTFGSDEAASWRVVSRRSESRAVYELQHNGRRFGIDSSLSGRHNALNVAAAVAAAHAVGVDPARAIRAIPKFKSVKRRLERLGILRGVSVYDDFAHHPTAISATLAGLREQVGAEPIVAVLEPRSNTMRMGVHRDTLASSLIGADRVLLYAPADLGWDLGSVIEAIGAHGSLHTDMDSLVHAANLAAIPGSHFLIMSNGAFGGFQQRLLTRLAS